MVINLENRSKTAERILVYGMLPNFRRSVFTYQNINARFNQLVYIDKKGIEAAKAIIKLEVEEMYQMVFAIKTKTRQNVVDLIKTVIDSFRLRQKSLN